MPGSAPSRWRSTAPPISTAPIEGLLTASGSSSPPRLGPSTSAPSCNGPLFRSIPPPPRSASVPTRCRGSSPGCRSSCAASPWTSTAPFQCGDCAALPFKPKLAIRLEGGLGRGAHPALRAVLRNDPEGAAPASIAFTFPSGELLDLRHLRDLCSRESAADSCPPSSRLGSLRFDSPFLGGSLGGSVYLRRPSHRFPDLIVDLRSDRLHFVLL